MLDIHTATESSQLRAQARSQRHDRSGSSTSRRLASHHLQPHPRRPAADHPHSWRLPARAGAVPLRPGFRPQAFSTSASGASLRRQPGNSTLTSVTRRQPSWPSPHASRVPRLFGSRSRALCARPAPRIDRRARRPRGDAARGCRAISRERLRAGDIGRRASSSREPMRR